MSYLGALHEAHAGVSHVLSVLGGTTIMGKCKRGDEVRAVWIVGELGEHALANGLVGKRIHREIE